MTIFDAVRKEDFDNWVSDKQDGRNYKQLPTLKAISLEDLRKEIEGMRHEYKADNEDFQAGFEAFGADLLKKLEEK